MAVRVPFIETQRVYHLDPEVPDAKYWLHPDRFRYPASPESGRDNNDEQENPWRELERHRALGRLVLFLHPRVRRLCLVDSGGYGKTSALKHLALSTPAPYVTICIELNDLPPDANPEEVLEIFANRFRQAPGNSDVSEAYFQHLVKVGRLTLCVDGLDQTNAKEVHGQIRSLKTFLSTSDYADHIRIIMAGRPHAVIEFWDDLFSSNSESNRAHSWQFARLSDFDSEGERQRFLGQRHYEHLEQRRLAAALSPRALWMVRQIDSDSDLAKLHSESDIYWHVLYGNDRNNSDGMLDRAARTTLAKEHRLGKDEILQRLSMLAWEMVRTEQRGGIGGRKRVEDFLIDSFKQHKSLFRRDDLDKFLLRTTAVVSLNESLEPGVLEPDSGIDRINFSNQGQLEFLAALWLCRWASPEDQRWCRENLPHRTIADVKNPEWLNRIWTFISAMPTAAIRESQLTWLNTIAHLFRKFERSRYPRPTRWMYICWRRLLSYAYLGTNDWVEVSVPPIRCDDDEFCSTERDRKAVMATAKWILNEFRNKPAQADATRRNVSWILCPPKHTSHTLVDGHLTFMMGTPENEKEAEPELSELLPEPFHQTTVRAHFQIQTAPVTNDDYQQFDPWYQRVYEHRQLLPESPAVLIDWFDSFIYACWISPQTRLPTEQEWEFACRAESPPGQLRWWGTEDCPSKRWFFKDGNDFEVYGWPPSHVDHSNGWGIQDQIGLCWEATSTVIPGKFDYREEYRKQQTPSKCWVEHLSVTANVMSARVARGGAVCECGVDDLRCGNRSCQNLEDGAGLRMVRFAPDYTG